MAQVSIIIPTYNAEKFINQTINSVINQTYQDWELIIVDDFSQDSTREILKRWKEKNNKIKIIFLEKNSGGPAHPKNVGFLQASGKYIAYLDHDDEWLPEKLAKQVAVLESDNSVGLISCEASTINVSGKIIGQVKIENIPEDGVFPRIFFVDFICSNSSIVIPRRVIEKVGGRDESVNIGIAEDREIEMRIASAGYKLYVIHEPLFNYRVHDNNASVLGAPLCYAEANLKYIEDYKKYNSEYLVFERFAREYLKKGDIAKAKKYCQLTFLQKKDLQLRLLCFLLSFGEIGINLSQQMLKLRTTLKYSKKS